MLGQIQASSWGAWINKKPFAAPGKEFLLPLIYFGIKGSAPLRVEDTMVTIV
jgi:hypothetical protein